MMASWEMDEADRPNREAKGDGGERDGHNDATVCKTVLMMRDS